MKYDIEAIVKEGKNVKRKIEIFTRSLRSIALLRNRKVK